MLPIFPKIGKIWPLQVDLQQQLGHLWHLGQNSSDLHSKHNSHILFLEDKQCRDLCLSFVATLLQKEHELQDKSFQVKKFAVSLLRVTNSPSFWPHLHSNYPVSDLPVTCTQFLAAIHVTQ